MFGGCSLSRRDQKERILYFEQFPCLNPRQDQQPSDMMKNAVAAFAAAAVTLTPFAGVQAFIHRRQTLSPH